MRLYEILIQENITTITEAESKLSAAEKKYAEILQQIQELKERISTLESEINSSNHYFDDMSFMQRTFPKKDEDKTAVAVIKEHGFKKKEDTSVLLEQLEKYKSELAELNEKLSSSGGEIRKYKEIVDEYYLLNNDEDHISKLVREAKERTTSEEWNNMIAQQRKVILEELDTLTDPPMYHLEKQIWDKIVKLRSMKVEPYEVEKLIRTLAVIRIDKIDSTETARRLFARMKSSAASVKDISKRASFLRRCRDYDDMIEVIRSIDIYPPERKPTEQKKTPPKKNHRR